MPVEVVVPNLGEGGMELAFAGWLKREGDLVQAGDDIFEIDTDKVTVSVQAFHAGVLTDLRVHAGDVVERGQVVAALLVEGDVAVQQPGRAGAAPEREAQHAVPRGAGMATQTPAPGLTLDLQVRQPNPHEARRPASPRAKRAAARFALALQDVQPARPDGLITEADVLLAHRVKSAPRRERARKSVADLSARSWQSVPHLYLRHDLGLSRVKLPSSGLLGLMTTLLVAVLVAEPDLNVELRDSGPRPRASIDIGIFMTTESGTVLPRLTDCQNLAGDEIARRVSEITTRTRNGLLRPEDYGPRSASIYNMSAYPIQSAQGVIPAGDAMLVTIGRPAVVPLWSGAAWVPTDSVCIGLALDHRAFSAADGGRLFGRLDAILDTWRTEG